MRIGIDIDGVLTDIEKWQLDYGSKFYYEKYKMNIVDFKGYDISNIFGVSIEEEDLFWMKNFEFYSKNIKARDFSSEIISKLKKDGNEIYIITARGSFLFDSGNTIEYEKNKATTIKWLEINNIIYDKILFTPEDKLAVCIQNNIDLMIEDKPKNILEISTEIPVICFNANYNKNCKNDNIYRCYSWYNIYKTIKDMK